MKLTSKIYSNDDYVGSITFDNDFLTEPPDSDFLKNILKEPIFVDIYGVLTDVYADRDPVLFMENLGSHYKSQGLRATEAENSDHDDD